MVPSKKSTPVGAGGERGPTHARLERRFWRGSRSRRPRAHPLASHPGPGFGHVRRCQEAAEEEGSCRVSHGVWTAPSAEALSAG